jgi:hypothetical protein
MSSKVKIGKFKINVFLTGVVVMLLLVYTEFPLSTLETFATDFASFFSSLEKKKPKSRHFYYNVETFFNNEVWQLFIIYLFYIVSRAILS